MRTIANRIYYPLVAAVIFLVAFLVDKIPFFEKGLTVTPFFLVVAVVALTGDYILSVFTIILSCIAVVYVIPPAGFQQISDASTKLIEYLASSVIVCALAWRSRRLYEKNKGLSSAIAQLRAIKDELERKSTHDKQALNKLKKLNEELEQLVNQFIEDDDYWHHKFVNAASKTEHYKKYVNKKA